jgi:hypothetical protein
MLKATELFERTQLEMCGPVSWGASVAETASGVYVITLANPASVLIDVLPASVRLRWNADQEIIYIGRATKLSKRLSQFYRHKFGAPSPHRGGQDIKLLEANTLVCWAISESFREAEKAMIDIFKSEVGRLPFGNKIASAQNREKIIPAIRR